MYASSTVIGFSGRLVILAGAGGWSYRGLSEIRSDESPGNILGRESIKDQVFILLADISTAVRAGEKTSEGPASSSAISGGDPGRIPLMSFPRRDSRVRLGRMVRCRMEKMESKLLYSNVKLSMEFDIGDWVDNSWLEDRDKAVREANRYVRVATFNR